MMSDQIPRGCGQLVVGAVAVLILLVFIGPCQSRPEPNAELAQTARQAVEMAREAQQANDAAYIWPGRLRVIAVVVGTAVPILAAALLVYLMTKRRPDDLELFSEIEAIQKRLGCDQGQFFRRLPRAEQRKTPEALPPTADLDPQLTAEGDGLRVQSRDAALAASPAPDGTEGKDEHPAAPRGGERNDN